MRGIQSPDEFMDFVLRIHREGVVRSGVNRVSVRKNNTWTVPYIK